MSQMAPEQLQQLGQQQLLLHQQQQQKLQQLQQQSQFANQMGAVFQHQQMVAGRAA